MLFAKKPTPKQEFIQDVKDFFHRVIDGRLRPDDLEMALKLGFNVTEHPKDTNLEINQVVIVARRKKTGVITFTLGVVREVFDQAYLVQLQGGGKTVLIFPNQVYEDRISEIHEVQCIIVRKEHKKIFMDNLKNITIVDLFNSGSNYKRFKRISKVNAAMLGIAYLLLFVAYLAGR